MRCARRLGWATLAKLARLARLAKLAKNSVERDYVFQPEFREDLRHWVEVDRRTAGRVLSLVEAVLRDPLEGIGKPERLRHLSADTWSRRITQEHRLVYLVRSDRIDFLQARYHY